MGSVAGQIFTLLFGWFRSLVVSLWGFFSGQTGGSALRWVGEHWLLLAGLLCLAGTVIDIIVHLIRWRPYRVWASFFRKHFGHEDEDEPENEPEPLYTDSQPLALPAAEAQPVYETQPVYEPEPVEMTRTWVYADGSSVTEAPDGSLMAVEPDAWRPPAQREATTPASVPVAEPEPVSRTVEAERQQSSSRDRLRRRMADLPKQFGLSMEEDEFDIRYEPAQPTVRKEDAYRAPVFPTKREPAAAPKRVGRRSARMRKDGTA